MYHKFLLLTCVCFISTLQLASQQVEKEVLKKNDAFAALLFSYSKTKKQNNKTLLENVVYSNTTKFSIESGIGYFIGKQFAIGINFDYATEKENSEAINALGPNTVALRDLKTYTFTPFIRNYFPVGVKNKFFLFTQTGIAIGIGNGSDSTVTGNTTRYADIRNRDYGISFTPGLIFLVKDGFAFEINVGVLGFNHSKQTITPTTEEPTEIIKTDFNFNINLLSLGLGISYYF